MTVYLGSQGVVELDRLEENVPAYAFTVTNNKIRVSEDLLDTGSGHSFLTGDLVNIRCKEGSTLSFFSDSTIGGLSTFSAYVHVTDGGGMRFYEDLADAFADIGADAYQLQEFTDAAAELEVTLKVISDEARLLAQVTSFELNTARETADVTSLDDEYRERINTLISGSGQLSAFWDYTGESGEEETPNYILELANRTKIGSTFAANFFLKVTGYNPSGVVSNTNDQVYYAIKGIITGAAVSFDTNSLIRIVMEFVTTGPINLLVGAFSPGAILYEDSDGTGAILWKNGEAPGKLMQEQD